MLTYLLLAAFGFGMALGVVLDLFRLSRVLLGARGTSVAMQARYATPIPLLGRPLKVWGKSRLCRLLLPVVLFVEDLCWFLIAASGTAVLHYWLNSGRFRFFTVTAMGLGCWLYCGTVGRLVMRLSEEIVFWVRAACALLLALILRPLLKMVAFLGGIVEKSVKKLQNTLAKKRKMLYNKRMRKWALIQARQGFLKIAYKKSPRREK